MIITTLNKKGLPRKPYLTIKNRKYEGGSDHPEGKWQVWLYREDVILHNVKYHKYCCIRYAGDAARFKTRDEAKKFAYYRLGLPVD